MSRTTIAVAALALAALAPRSAVRADAAFGATDDFESSHTWEGHSETIPCGFCGFPLENQCLCPPESEQQGVSTQLGGPDGTLDTFLQLSPLPSHGVEAWNRASDRTGDYNVAGITGVALDLENLGTSALAVRIGLERGPTRWVTSDASAVALPGSSGWSSAGFALDEAAMTRVAGSDPLSWVLDRVEDLRILHAASAQWSGDSDSILGVDNIVLPEPASATALALGAALVGGLARRRRRHPAER